MPADTPKPGKLYVWRALPHQWLECPVCGMVSDHYHPEGWQKPKDLIMGLPTEVSVPSDTPETIEQILYQFAEKLRTLKPDESSIPAFVEAGLAITTHIEAAYQRGQYEANMDIVGCPGTASQIRDYACHMAAKHNHKEPQRHE